MQGFRIEPYLTILYVVPLRIAKAGIEIMLDLVQRRIFAFGELGLDLVE